MKTIYKIADGNPTLLVWDAVEREKIIQKYLDKEAEQIGFITMEQEIPKLSMMGNELCINALLALAYATRGAGTLWTSGTRQKISYRNNKKTTIQLDLSYRKIDNIVLLPGIGYVVAGNKKEVSKERLMQLCNTYKKAAFGMLLFENNTMYPYIYVKKTDSFIAETSCGSGSIAANILLGFSMIRQITGECISVKRYNKTFFVTAKVRKTIKV